MIDRLWLIWLLLGAVVALFAIGTWLGPPP